MNCEEFRELLSPYHDGELAAERQLAVEQHLDTCEDCSRSLAEVRTLSDMAERLNDPEPPEALWSAIARGLDQQQVTNQPQPARRPFSPTRKYALALGAAILLVGVGLWLSRPHDDGHSHIAVNFNHFLEEFPRNPAAAQQVLLTQYDHDDVDLDEAARQVRYRPLATEQLPYGYTLDKVYVMQMPCCMCVQCLYKGANDESLALFEHDTDQSMWFGKRPAITCACKGRQTRIVPFNGQLAASWPAGKRHLTVIGASDIEHVVALVGHFGESTAE